MRDFCFYKLFVASFEVSRATNGDVACAGSTHPYPEVPKSIKREPTHSSSEFGSIWPTSVKIRIGLPRVRVRQTWQDCLLIPRM